MRLPDIMVAPNGAYKTKLDHPNLPMTLDETIGAVAAAHRAGAGGAHVHLRDAEGKHLLDAAQYRILIDGVQLVPIFISKSRPKLRAAIHRQSRGR